MLGSTLGRPLKLVRQHAWRMFDLDSVTLPHSRNEAMRKLLAKAEVEKSARMARKREAAK